MTELNIKNLTYSIGDKIILDNISFSVSSGDVVAVVGKNGVGKTTLLNNILEKLNKTNEINLVGENPTLGYVPQFRQIDDELPLSAADFVSLPIQKGFFPWLSKKEKERQERERKEKELQEAQKQKQEEEKKAREEQARKEAEAKQIAEAADQAVQQLENNPVQENISSAQAAVERVADPTTKSNLTDRIGQVQNAINQRAEEARQEAKRQAAEQQQTRTVYVAQYGKADVYWYSMENMPSNTRFDRVVAMTETDAIASGKRHTRTSVESKILKKT